MRVLSIKQKAIAGLAGTGLLIATAGAAYAVWGANGSGSGSAATGQAGDVTIAGTVSGVFPGPGKKISVTVTNPNDFPVDLPLLHTTITGVTGAKGSCSAADYSIPDVLGPITVSANAALEPISSSTSPTISLIDAPDGCQNAQLVLSFSTSVPPVTP